ncbi:hypothetical protein KY290_024358 [Solanum tuberosum]|uniref:Uncharacterized protein n=1 Tax=Solanum tuberosum TaxID=4113 RepID=A0ABQ7USG9_SOLTU|nr:hypothetical protein KY290_024358 [Solanum tuberosum]
MSAQGASGRKETLRELKREITKRMVSIIVINDTHPMGCQDETFRTTINFGDNFCIAIKGKWKCGSASRDWIRGVYQAWNLQNPKF